MSNFISKISGKSYLLEITKNFEEGFYNNLQKDMINNLCVDFDFYTNSFFNFNRNNITTNIDISPDKDGFILKGILEINNLKGEEIEKITQDKYITKEEFVYIVEEMMQHKSSVTFEDKQFNIIKHFVDVIKDSDMNFLNPININNLVGSNLVGDKILLIKGRNVINTINEMIIYINFKNKELVFTGVVFKNNINYDVIEKGDNIFNEGNSYEVIDVIDDGESYKLTLKLVENDSLMIREDVLLNIIEDIEDGVNLNSAIKNNQVVESIYNIFN